ncbi:MAG: hypothetical protein ABFE07_09595 [Armatimonadia bacterium]
MRRYLTVLLPICGLIVASLALAGWNPTPMSATSEQKALSKQMSTCVQPEQMSLSDMNQENALCPMVMPMKSTATDGQVSMCPIRADQAIPADATMITILVPVSFTQMDGKQVMDVNVDSDLASSVVLMSMSCNGQNVLQPMKLTPAGDDVIVLVPLNAASIAQPASVPVYVEGEMKMVPVDESVSTSGLAVECSAQGQTKVMCGK